VNLISTVARSILMSSASVMAHWRAVSYELNQHRDASDALSGGSRELVKCVVGQLRLEEKRSYSASQLDQFRCAQRG